MYTIYGLVDPRTFYICYVGITESHAAQRYVGHYKGKINPDKIKWLDELKALGLEPTLIILEQGADLTWGLRREQYWIHVGADLGWPLLNKARSKRKAAPETRRTPPAPRRLAPVVYQPGPDQTYEPKPPAPHKWDEWIRAYMKEHPSLYQTPPRGIRDMARQMSLQETGTAENMTRYLGIASSTVKYLQGAQDE